MLYRFIEVLIVGLGLGGSNGGVPLVLELLGAFEALSSVGSRLLDGL